MDKKIYFGASLLLICSLSVRSQIFQPSISPTDSTQKIVIQKESDRQDSLSKVVMRDSLHLSDKVISQVFSTKENFIEQSQQIRSNNLLSPVQKEEQLRSLLGQADAAIKNLMGADAYLKYGAMEQKRLLLIY